MSTILGQMTRASSVLVITDPPTFSAHSEGKVMPTAALNHFLRVARTNDFSAEDFAFITCAPPIPDEIKKSDKRISEHLEPHIDKVHSAIRTYEERIGKKFDLVICLGKYAAKQYLKRIVHPRLAPRFLALTFAAKIRYTTSRKGELK